MIAYLKLFRFPLVFTAVADSAAGYLLASRGAPQAAVLALLAVASGGLYCFGMAMNDIADLERDRALYPNRVLPSGRLLMRPAIAAAVVVAVLSGIAVLLVPEAPFARVALWLVIVFFIVAYDFFLKWPIVMGLIRAFNFLLGVAAAYFPQRELDPVGASALVFAGASFVYVTALTFVSTLEEGEVSKARLFFGVGLMILAAAAPALVISPFWRPEAGLPRAGEGLVLRGNPAASLAALLLIAWLAARGARARDRRGVMLLVRDGVAGIIVLDATLLLAAGLTVPGIVVAGLVLPAALLVAVFKRLG